MFLAPAVSRVFCKYKEAAWSCQRRNVNSLQKVFGRSALLVLRVAIDVASVDTHNERARCVGVGEMSLLRATGMTTDKLREAEEIDLPGSGLRVEVESRVRRKIKLRIADIDFYIQCCV